MGYNDTKSTEQNNHFFFLEKLISEAGVVAVALLED